MTCTTPASALKDLPPSAKVAYKVLSYEGPSTQQEITAEARLPARTVRYAIRQLEETDLVEERIHIQDARQQLYSVTD